MYITPRVLIQQEFLQLPVYAEFPLPAFIVGPNYDLHRYSVAEEKASTAVGTLDGVAYDNSNNYDPVGGEVTINSSLVQGTRYDIPNIPAGGHVDQEYTKVFAEAVEAQYFPLESLGSYNENAVVELVAGPGGQYHANRLRFTEVRLKTENGYDRSSCFDNRDVVPGDILEVVDSLGNTARSRISNVLAMTAVEDSNLASQIAPQVMLSEGNYLGYGQGNDSINTFTATDDSVFVASEVVGNYITIVNTGAVRKIVGLVDEKTLLLSTILPVNPDEGDYGFYIGGTYADIYNAPTTNMVVSNAVNTLVNPEGNAVSVSNASSTYVGYNNKNILADTYRITVTTGGTGASALTDVRFTVESLSNAFAPVTGVSLDHVNTQYLLTLDNNNGNNLVLNFTGSTAFVAGAKYSVAFTAGVTEVQVYAEGNYVGPIDMTYKVTVERGGAFYDGSNATTCARLKITASDIDTPSLVLPKLDTLFPVGKFGVQAGFDTAANNGGLIAGDVYFIPVLAPKHGAAMIVELAENLPAAMLTPASTNKLARLFLTQRSIEIPQLRDLEGLDYNNWDQEDAYISINAGWTTYTPKLAVLGTPARLPITSAKVFVEHRDLLTTNVVAIDSVRDLASIKTKLGIIHPDNPLAQGVHDAVLNANGQVVYFLGVATDDLAGYEAAIKIAEKSDKVYSFVPMTFDRAIQDAIISHVNAYSTPEVGRWRIAWISVEDKKTYTMYDLKEDGETTYTATITDDPSVSNTQYKLVTVEGARFIDDGVRPTDTIRLNFRLNPAGKVVYDEYVVDTVKSNTTLTITRALTTPINVPVRVQVVRNYTKSERAYNIAHIGGDYNNRRVRCVFPDSFKYDGIVKQGYFAAAGLAGMRSGVVPHQGLTNAEYYGADDLSKVVIEFSQDDLNVMAEQGIWILTQEVLGATPYVRHQLTTDTSGLNTSEDSITTNVDNISYALKHVLNPFIGRWNVNPQSVVAVRDAVTAELYFRAYSTYTVRAGNQLVSFNPKTDIVRLEQNPTYKDRIDCEVRLHVPYPMNYINLKLIVGD